MSHSTRENGWIFKKGNNLVFVAGPRMSRNVTNSCFRFQPGRHLIDWIVLGMNNVEKMMFSQKKWQQKNPPKNLDSPFNFHQDCQTLCPTRMPSKQVPMSSVCRCMRSAVQQRRTVWPGNLWCQKWFTSSVRTKQHVDTEADTHTHTHTPTFYTITDMCFLCFDCLVRVHFTRLRTMFGCIGITLNYLSMP